VKNTFSARLLHVLPKTYLFEAPSEISRIPLSFKHEGTLRDSTHLQFSIFFLFIVMMMMMMMVMMIK